MIALIVTGIFITVLLYLLKINVSASIPGLPPGPKFLLPLVGHLFFLSDKPHLKFLEWIKKYGPIFTLQFGVYRVVVINNGQLLKQAFNSPVLAGRPNIKVMDDYSKRLGLVGSDGARGREQRKFALKNLKDLMAAGGSMEARIVNESEDLAESLKNLAGQPLNVHGFFNRNVINELLYVILSKRFEKDDPMVLELVRMVTGRAAQISGLLPILSMYIPKLCDWFPTASGYNLWMQLDQETRSFLRPIIEQHEATLVPGQPRDLLDVCLERKRGNESHPQSSLIVEHTLKELLLAGMETTSSQLEWIVYFMAKYPSVQSKMQAEIDSKLGDRLPSLNDRLSMPFTDAVIQETLRKSSVSPFGITHRAVEDFQLGEYTIPSDTWIIGNVYGVNHDPEVWGNPEEFWPERFIGFCGDDKSSEICNAEGVVSFGTGKRSCIGEGLARNELFLFTVSMFQNFNVKAYPSKEALLDEYRFAVAVTPVPFKVVFQRRTT